MKKFALVLSVIFLSQLSYASEKFDVRMGTEKELESANHMLPQFVGNWVVTESTNPWYSEGQEFNIVESLQYYFAGENCITIKPLGLSIYPSEMVNSTSSMSERYAARVYKEGVFYPDGYWLHLSQDKTEFSIAKMPWQDGELNTTGFGSKWEITLKRPKNK